jgi:AraC-like DNA-binding protein
MRRERTGPCHKGGVVRVGILVGLPELLRSLGADPAAMVADAGLDLNVFEDPDNMISFAARGRLFSLCVERTGCKHLGLVLGQQGRMSSLGLVGFLTRYSPDVETALRNLVRYTHLQVRGGVTTLAVHGELAVLSFDVVLPHLEANDQTGDGAMAMFHNILRTLCGPDWQPIEVRFSHGEPDDVRPFRRFFHCPLFFDAEQNSIVFSSDWLRRPVPGDDPELRRLVQRQIDALEARHRDDFPEQVRSVLRTALATGQANEGHVSALFSMNSRTLRRRLSDSGVSFKGLVEEVRFAIAQQMLEHSIMDVSQIAASLGYSDASAFIRAFRRWSETTPALWRATHASGARGSEVMS